jgi:hypothetical protein
VLACGGIGLEAEGRVRPPAFEAVGVVEVRGAPMRSVAGLWSGLVQLVSALHDAAQLAAALPDAALLDAALPDAAQPDAALQGACCACVLPHEAGQEWAALWWCLGIAGDLSIWTRPSPLCHSSLTQLACL